MGKGTEKGDEEDARLRQVLGMTRLRHRGCRGHEKGGGFHRPPCSPLLWVAVTSGGAVP